MRGLAQTLVLNGAVDAATMSHAVTRFGETAELERHLISQRLVTEAQVARAVAEQSSHEYHDLTDTQLDPAVIALVPGALCRKYQLIPIEVRPASLRPTPRRPLQMLPEHFADELVIGMVDPTDIIAIDDVASLTDMVIEPVVVARDALARAFERFIRSDDELREVSAALEEDAASEVPVFTESIEGQAGDAPVVRFVNLLIAQAVNDRASDIHIEPGEHRLTVRYRIDGVLHEMQRADRGIQDGVISRLKIMSQIDIAERRRPQDGRMTVAHEGRTVDLRVASLPTVWGEKVVMRILDNSAQSLSLSDLGMSIGNRERFDHAITRPHGMVLVTGPTGSGKSTTLYAALGEVANTKVNVITVEDPVEFRIPGINQVQVNHKAGLTFSSALRSILRCDPDIVLVGEIRDKETAITSIEAALTGHLVLSTLHTNDAPSALTRLIEIGAEPYLVGTALSVAVAQRLARRLCDRCRQPAAADPAVLTRLRFPFDPAALPPLYRAVGCSTCAGTGYRGRLALQEVMVVTEEIEHLVARNSTGADLRALAVEQGMVPLRQDGWAKVARGLTTIEEVLRVSV
ncbi:MAG TPA: ATPase, T2SS/T4P/T4SS family [Propionicimonas sp.]|jgi:type IV pilus assembly protein PilB|nr:ATPase, T2SS/T4P/T4SS family [Propionicimonas sp.]